VHAKKQFAVKSCPPRWHRSWALVTSEVTMRLRPMLIVAAVALSVAGVSTASAHPHHTHEKTPHVHSHHSWRLAHTRIGLPTAPGQQPGVEKAGRGPYRVRDRNYGWRR
jgi:hypothetical protein